VDVLEIVDTDLEHELDEKDDESFAHYAEAASVTEGYIMGTPVMAICGKIFVPSKNPERLRICPVCKEIMDALFLSEE
jgi:hypothetical protein